jgi:alpha-beta hydrolase superfamily lysophospholipase
MLQSRIKARRRLLQIGATAWGLLFLGAIALFFLPMPAGFNLWQLPLGQFAVLLAGVGAVAFAIAGVLSRTIRPYVLFITGVAFVLINALAFFGAYTLTHFNDSLLPGLAFAPKPENARKPSDFGLDYATERITINEQEWLEAWRIPYYGKAKGTVLLFPGNGGNKDQQLILPGQAFHELGYHTLLVDFRGQGGSSGSSATMGLREAEDVAYALQHAEKIGLPKPHILYGVSIGSAAILKAVKDDLTADALVLELPFAYFMRAVKTRMKAQDFPTLGIAELLVFWGGIQHGYNGFTHNPANYAKSVTMPAIVLHGEKDRWTTVAEVQRLFENLQGSKELVIFPNAGHNLLVSMDRAHWMKSIGDFLDQELGS